MQETAERMRALGLAPTDGGAPASIFGSAGSLAQSVQRDERFRIAVYPVISQDAPEIAMGLAACLCYLLEQHADARVYRCFLRVDAADDSGELRSDDFQFTPEDFEYEGLADNALLCGALEREGSLYRLRLDLDLSLLRPEAGGTALTAESDSIAGLADALPQLAAEIYAWLEGQTAEAAILAYAEAADSRALESIISAVFEWNLDVCLALWDMEWDEADIRDQFLELAEACRAADSAFAYWALGMTAGQVMQAGLEHIGDIVAELAPAAIPGGTKAAAGAAAIAIGLSRLKRSQAAVDLLAPYLEASVDAGVWSAMIDIYWAASQLDAAIDACQSALEQGIEQAPLYWTYSELLMACEAQGWALDEVLLIDPAESEAADHIALEIAGALKLYQGRRPQDLGALQLALAYMIDAGDDELWLYFERLIERDRDGLAAAEVIDRLIDLEDYSPAHDIVAAHVDSNPFAYVYLAQLALAEDDASQAQAWIDACRERFSSLDSDLELELQRFELQARLPAFAEAFAEIKVLLSAQRPVREAQVELLEEAIEIAPKMVDVYALLARCYRSWKDDESALEVLQDAENKAGAHPQVAQGMARIHWARREREAAVAKLNETLESFPRDVSLLAQLANYLIKNGQFDDAREYLLLAESISPSHGAIWQARRLVAQSMSR